ncbi:YggS family pyridoxal phosphate-dependent enzyme [Methyloglobulus sp.]|uniref:YggS family pyridoxal phosphate-dependent enzyme n=1 Tax=Methyloglobulus sp. TaxID=2518622 RepID=UPI0032B7EA9C
MTIAQSITAIRSQIEEYCHACQRNPETVLLLAVSKTKPASDIAAGYQAGLRHFGENYCQEALLKQQELGAYNITWHFIGPIQSNKTKLISHHFSWVHSVDSLRIAKRLSEQRPTNLPPLNICLQVNVSGEQSKSGISLAELPALCSAVAVLPRLKLRGVMAIPAPQDDFEQQRLPYKRLVQAVVNLNLPELNTYSFGMTDDLKAAITESSTIVRIGTALFGSREGLSR